MKEVIDFFLDDTKDLSQIENNSSLEAWIKEVSKHLKRINRDHF